MVGQPRVSFRGEEGDEGEVEWEGEVPQRRVDGFSCEWAGLVWLSFDCGLIFL